MHLSACLSLAVARSVCFTVCLSPSLRFPFSLFVSVLSPSAPCAVPAVRGTHAWLAPRLGGENGVNGRLNGKILSRRLMISAVTASETLFSSDQSVN